MLLGLRAFDLPHNLLLLHLLNLLILGNNLLTHLLSRLPVLKLDVVAFSLCFLAELLFQLLNGAFMLSTQFICLSALCYQLRAELVFNLCINLVLLAKLIENLT